MEQGRRDAFRDIVVDVIGGGLVDEGYGGDVDAELLWWRRGREFWPMRCSPRGPCCRRAGSCCC
ncbi:DUF3052 family protein [Rhodococcus sp. WS4]|nr:DUF3052 family protein [Rhodococcus sp. WS4]